MTVLGVLLVGGQWWIKILETHERLVKSYYNELIQLNKLKLEKIKDIWASKIKHILEKLVFKHVFVKQYPEDVQQHLEEIMLKLQERIKNEDLIAESNSKYSCNFMSIVSSHDYLMKEIICFIRHQTIQNHKFKKMVTDGHHQN